VGPYPELLLAEEFTRLHERPQVHSRIPIAVVADQELCVEAGAKAKGRNKQPGLGKRRLKAHQRERVTQKNDLGFQVPS